MMNTKIPKQYLQSGFTLVEVSIVLLIVVILLGYTLAMFPVQQELKQYRQARSEIDKIKDALIGFAQINGRLPCPALPSTQGKEAGGGSSNCDRYGGFVPANTLGLTGRINRDGLMIDPWGQPYRYYISDSDFFADDDGDGSLDDDGNGDPDGNGKDDFTNNGEIKDVGLTPFEVDEDVDGVLEITGDGDGDGVSDGLALDANLVICSQASSSSDRCSVAGSTIFGNVIDVTESGTYSGFSYSLYNGAPVVILSLGKNGAGTPSTDELENRGSTRVVADWGETAGPSGQDYFIDTDSVFVRTSGQREDFDDLVDWISPSVLFSKMIEAGQLP